MSAHAASIAAHADPEASAAVLGMATGYWMSGVVYVLARIGIADLLAATPRDSTTLAAAAGVRAHPLARFLRAAAHLGLLVSDAAGRWHLTPRGDVLRSDIPGSLRNNVLSVGRWQRDA